MSDKPETITSLARKYSVSLPTFKKWIAAFLPDLKPACRVLTPEQVKTVIKELGEYE